MSAALGREIFYIEIWHFAALLVILGVNSWFYRNAEKNGLFYRYLMLQGALLLWVISKMLKSVAPTEALRWSAIVSQYLGVSFLGPFFFLFAWHYVYGRDLAVGRRLILYGLSFFFFLVMATNPYHHLFYATYTFYRDTFGPVFFGLSFYTYLLILVSTLLFLHGMRRRHGAGGAGGAGRSSGADGAIGAGTPGTSGRSGGTGGADGDSGVGQSSGVGTSSASGMSGTSGDLFVALSAVLPLLINAAYTYNLFKQRFDYTPLFMTLSLAFFGLAAFRSRFLGVLPAAWKSLFMELEDPLILTGRGGKVRRVMKLTPGTRPQEKIVQGGRIYRLHREKKGRRRSLYHYVDVTSIEELKQALVEKNRQLESAIEEIRRRNRKTLELMKADLLNRSRRELHDILGHSLTQVIYLLRLEKLETPLPEPEKGYGGHWGEGCHGGKGCDRDESCHGDRSLIRTILTDGLTRLEGSLRGEVREGNSLSIALGGLLNSFYLPEVSVEFLLRGNERPLPEELVGELTGCCREGITNAVKHGKAERIDLVLLYGTKKLALLLHDNGSGCTDCRRGNGLSLMEEGLSRFDGSLATRSEPEEGYQLTIRIPYPAVLSSP